MAVHLIDTRPGSHIQEVCQAAMETSAVFIVMGSPDYGEATRDNMAHTRWELSCWRCTLETKRSTPLFIQMVDYLQNFEFPAARAAFGACKCVLRWKEWTSRRVGSGRPHRQVLQPQPRTLRLWLEPSREPQGAGTVRGGSNKLSIV